MGLGHAGRSLIIADELKRKGCELVFSSYGDAAKILCKEGYRVYETIPLQWAETNEWKVDPRKTFLDSHLYIMTLLEHLLGENANIRRENPELVISDSRVSTILAATLLKKPIITIVHQVKLLLPDFFKEKRETKTLIENLVSRVLSKFWEQGEKILVPDFEPPMTLAKSHLNLPVDYRRKIVFTGPFIRKKPSEYPLQDELKEEMGFKGKTVIYFACGGTPTERSSFFEKAMKIIDVLPREYTSIVTRGEPLNDRVVFRDEKRIIFNWFRDRYLLLKTCDLLVSRGGHNTVSEAIYYGKPLIIIPTPNHPEHQEIAKNAFQLGLAKVYQQEEKEIEIATGIQETIKDEGMLRKVKELSLEANKYDAISRAMKVIEETIEASI